MHKFTVKLLTIVHGIYLSDFRKDTWWELNRCLLRRFVESRGLHWVTLRSYVHDNANECQIRVERTFTEFRVRSAKAAWVNLAFIFILGELNYKSNTKRLQTKWSLASCFTAELCSVVETPWGKQKDKQGFLCKPLKYYSS